MSKKQLDYVTDEEMRYRRADYCLSALDIKCSEITEDSLSGENVRNALLSGSVDMFEYVGGGCLPEDVAFTKLVDTGVALGLTAYDSRRSVEWGKRKGLLSPKVPLLQDRDKIPDITTRRYVIDSWYQTVMSDPSIPTTAKPLVWSITKVALVTGKTRVGFSLRQFSLDSGLGMPAVLRQQKALSDYLSVFKKGNRLDGKPSVWQMSISGIGIGGDKGEFSIADHRSNDTEKDRVITFVPPTSNGEFSSGPLLNPSAEIWKTKKLAWLVYHSVLAGCSTQAKSLARELGVSDRAVRNNLAHLVDLGLLERFDDHTHEPVDQRGVDLTDMVGGERMERMSERHRLDRKAHKVWQNQKSEVIASSKRRVEHKKDFSQALRDSAGLVKPVSRTDVSSGGETRPDVLG